MNRYVKKIISTMILGAMLTYTMPIFAFTNEETVYSKLKSNGEKYKTIVSTKSDDGEGNENTQTDSDKELPLDTIITYKFII